MRVFVCRKSVFVCVRCFHSSPQIVLSQDGFADLMKKLLQIAVWVETSSAIIVSCNAGTEASHVRAPLSSPITRRHSHIASVIVHRPSPVAIVIVHRPSPLSSPVVIAIARRIRLSPIVINRPSPIAIASVAALQLQSTIAR